MQLKGSLMVGSMILAASLIGCSSSDSTMTDAQANALKNPPKTGMPPEAAAAMAKGAAQMKSNNEGVDSRGVPIAKSTLPANAGGPPPGTEPGK